MPPLMAQGEDRAREQQDTSPHPLWKRGPEPDEGGEPGVKAPQQAVAAVDEEERLNTAGPRATGESTGGEGAAQLRAVSAGPDPARQARAGTGHPDGQPRGPGATRPPPAVSTSPAAHLSRALRGRRPI